MAIKFFKSKTSNAVPIEPNEHQINNKEDEFTHNVPVATIHQEAKKPVEGFIFSLIGNLDSARLAMNGQIISTSELDKKGFTVTKSPIKGEPCQICAPKGSGLTRIWMCVSLFQNNIPGKIWVCSNCSKVYEHKRGGQELWKELQRSL